MNKRIVYFKMIAIIAGMTLLASCSAGTVKSSAASSAAASSTTVSGTNVQTTTDTNAAVVEYKDDDYYFDWKSSAFTTITLNGGSAAVTGTGAKVSGSAVTISKSGTYAIAGTLTDGSIVVDIDKSVDKGTVYIVLNGASITSQTSAPIYIKDAKKVVLLLETGTQNTVYGGSACVVNADNEPSAAIFSKADLTISGSGTLTVKSDFNDGITSKDVLKITDGTLIITTKADGIVGKDSINIEKANITITAGKDGMKSSNETDTTLGNVVIKSGQFTIAAANDAISAVNTLEIDNGTFSLTSGGGYPGKSINTNTDGGMQGGKPGQQTTTAAAASAEISKKGLKAGKNLIINGGTLTISSYDDAIHSNQDLTINNATITLQTGDDGIHAENNAVINSGNITIKNAYEGIEGTNITFNGGKISSNTTDDGINVNNSKGICTITGGEISINANGDGLDSNGTILMTGGTVYVDGPVANNNGAIDYDSNFKITGGTLVASGSSGMAQAPAEDSSQLSILMYYTSTQAAKTAITVKDESGNTVATFTPTKTYSSVAISSPLLKSGSTYTLYKNDTKVTSFKISSTLTYLTENGVTTRSQFQGPTGRK